MESEEDRKIRIYQSRGYYPSRWAHLHPELKALIRSMPFRPGIKNCFRNCQVIMLGARHTALESRLSYHEGVALSVIPIVHAWLSLDGTVQDPTATSMSYLRSNTYTALQIHEHSTSTGFWSPLDLRALDQLLIASFTDTAASKAW